MNILFDQGTPVPLRLQLVGHSVTTVYEQGWSTLSNGALLQRAEQAGYDLLITTDQNLRYQQNLTGRQIAILVLRSILSIIVGKVERATLAFERTS